MKNWKLVPVHEKVHRKRNPHASGGNLSLLKRDIDDLIDEFVETWRGLYCLYCLHETQPFKPKFRIYISLEELGRFWDLIVESKDRVVEIANAVARQMLDRNVFIFGAVDFDEASTTEKLHQSIELQNALVRVCL
ncbi:unnamed protein product [Eruca vesicaria subsp. sativa]|uniref:Uncharacterized protein n=1 Tax=Eruca vesicaria subsp. sativa TaxID=29727 RepID=A0ABC8JBC8_ERUVS|nr:unnamed protein product [Eruca vesicaria subsp. sativa]